LLPFVIRRTIRCMTKLMVTKLPGRELLGLVYSPFTSQAASSRRQTGNMSGRQTDGAGYRRTLKTKLFVDVYWLRTCRDLWRKPGAGELVRNVKGT